MTRTEMIILDVSGKLIKKVTNATEQIKYYFLKFQNAEKIGMNVFEDGRFLISNEINRSSVSFN